jgi:hypothetical protein
MYENDPDRLNRPRVGDPVRDRIADGSGMPGFATIAILGLVLLALALFLWPSDRATTVTENAPRIERPTPTPVPTPPANKPAAPTTPAPAPQQ